MMESASTVGACAVEVAAVVLADLALFSPEEV
jgi:hypothetical protein